MIVNLHKGDLPDGLDLGKAIAVDSETLGLNPLRDKLCVVQLSSGGDDAHLVQLDRATYDAPNLKAVLADREVLKIFHYARFDIAAIGHHLGIDVGPVYCTKIASRLTRTFTDRHGLKDLCRDLLGVELSKQQQTSDWGAAQLSEQQQTYAASDVLFLHDLKTRLDELLQRQDRLEFAAKCFEFLPTRAALDLAGWHEEDIFAHS